MHFLSQFYRREIRGKLRVWLSWIFVPVIFGTIRQRPEWHGILVLLAGGLLRVWASGYLEKEGVALCKSGPYRFSRNPLYLGSILIAVGIPISQNLWLLSAVMLAVSIGLHVLIIREEEKVLAEKYPGYREYCRAVPRFFSPWLFLVQLLPLLRKNARLDERQFNGKRWRHNKGWEPILVSMGMLAMALVVRYWMVRSGFPRGFFSS